VRRLYDVLETRLAASAFLGGGDYTIADIATYPWAANHERQGVSFADKPNLKRWHDAIAARPAVVRATKKADAMPTSRDKAKADDVDRFFGRGRYARA
jgi:GST-like protein